MDSAGATFREVRYFKRGWMAQWFLGLGVVCIGVAVFVEALRPVLVPAALLLAVPFFLNYETRVEDGRLSMQVRPFYRSSIPLSEVVAVETTIWDGQVGIFGGFTTRMDVVGAVLGVVEGDRSVGNKALILEMKSGKQRQLGTYAPKALIEALEREAGRPLLKAPEED